LNNVFEEETICDKIDPISVPKALENEVGNFLIRQFCQAERELKWMTMFH